MAQPGATDPSVPPSEGRQLIPPQHKSCTGGGRAAWCKEQGCSLRPGTSTQVGLPPWCPAVRCRVHEDGLHVFPCNAWPGRERGAGLLGRDGAEETGGKGSGMGVGSRRALGPPLVSPASLLHVPAPAMAASWHMLACPMDLIMGIPQGLHLGAGYSQPGFTCHPGQARGGQGKASAWDPGLLDPVCCAAGSVSWSRGCRTSFGRRVQSSG